MPMQGFFTSINYIFSEENASRAADLIILGLEYQVNLSGLGMGGLTSCTLQTNQREFFTPLGYSPHHALVQLQPLQKTPLVVGGRRGKNMGTFSSNDGLWRFDVATENWEALKTSGEQPEQRSYHTLAAHGVCLFIVQRQHGFSADTQVIEISVLACWMSCKGTP